MKRKARPLADRLFYTLHTYSGEIEFGGPFNTEAAADKEAESLCEAGKGPVFVARVRSAFVRETLTTKKVWS